MGSSSRRTCARQMACVALSYLKYMARRSCTITPANSGSTPASSGCLTRNRTSGRDYRCKACGFACHRDAVGAINILQKALYGGYVPIRGDTEIRVTYLRAVKRWSPDQRKAHHKVQSRKARALSIAQNRASTGTTRQSKPKQ
ncbi:MAG: zinc ribbon domain-containing protein, partial [Acidimicrobiales bacterium]